MKTETLTKKGYKPLGRKKSRSRKTFKLEKTDPLEVRTTAKKITRKQGNQ